jgi:hypothetical protein
MDPASISTIADLPVNTIPVIVAMAAAAYVSIRDDKRASASDKEEAEISLTHAYHMTQSYYSSMTNGQAKDYSQEYEIASAWQEASVRLRKFNKSLSNRLGIKSQFWQEGGAWTNEQISMAKIGLIDVKREGIITLRK